MAVDKALLSGSTAMLILKLLEEKDMYGYEMIEELRKRSQNVFELKAGTLYPLLHLLEETRKYYGVTEEGKRYFQQKKEEWTHFTDAVNSIICMEV